jgi:hypothetical protein
MGWVVNATPRPLHTRERPSTLCIRGCMCPRTGLDGWGKFRPQPGFDPRTVQPAAICYTDWAIPAHNYFGNRFVFLRQSRHTQSSPGETFNTRNWKLRFKDSEYWQCCAVAWRRVVLYVGVQVWEKLTASTFTEEEWRPLRKEVQGFSEKLILQYKTTRRKIQ